MLNKLLSSEFYYDTITKQNAPIYITKFFIELSRDTRKYTIFNPRHQSPVHMHLYITGTCRYQLTVLLIEINSVVEPLHSLKKVCR